MDGQGAVESDIYAPRSLRRAWQVAEIMLTSMAADKTGLEERLAEGRGGSG
jgi:hypothetical protein